MKIVGLSLITNKVIVSKEENQVHASHAEVLAATGISLSRVYMYICIYVNLCLSLIHL
jgi:hypothetical protein